MYNCVYICIHIYGCIHEYMSMPASTFTETQKYAGIYMFLCAYTCVSTQSMLYGESQDLLVHVCVEFYMHTSLF